MQVSKHRTFSQRHTHSSGLRKAEGGAATITSMVRVMHGASLIQLNLEWSINFYLEVLVDTAIAASVLLKYERSC